ncbi:unnamed protein product [Closterium sp. NIES-65]|nr:unnamed protein product [Closterium sp. NIES-65]CAI5954224.1 unnamed protein product [Closterium sp. NIES-65]
MRVFSRRLKSHASTSRPYQSQPLPSASPGYSSTGSPYTYGLSKGPRLPHSSLHPRLSPSLHSATRPLTSPLTAPINPLTSCPSSIPPPSSHCHSAAPISPSSRITVAMPPVSSQHYPSQHHLSQHNHSRSASPSIAASFASVNYSPPSSHTSSQRSAAPGEPQQLWAAPTASAGEASAAPHPTSTAASAHMRPMLPVLPGFPAECIENLIPAAAFPTPLDHALMDAPSLSPSALAAQHTRPHKTPRTTPGVLPPAALEFARSFFSGLPGRDDPQGGESSDGQQASKPACTSAIQDSCRSARSAETQCGCVGGDASTDFPPMACQPSFPDMGGAEGVECGVEKRAGLTAGLFCQLEDLRRTAL